MFVYLYSVSLKRACYARENFYIILSLYDEMNAWDAREVRTWTILYTFYVLYVNVSEKYRLNSYRFDTDADRKPGNNRPPPYYSLVGYENVENIAYIPHYIDYTQLYIVNS